MAVIQPWAVRTAIAARLLGAGIGFVAESQEPYEFIKATGRSPVHMEFAVGIPRSAPEGTVGINDRQRTSIGVWTETLVHVLFPYQLVSPNDRVASMTTALTVEAAVRASMMAKGWTADFHVLWATADRTPGLDGWIWFDQGFRTIHQMPLS